MTLGLLMCLWIKKITDIPVVVTIHGLDIVYPNYFYQRIIKNRFSIFDQFICVSHSTANECIQRGIDSEKISVVLNGVDKDLVEHSFDRIKTLAFLEEKYKIDLQDKKIIVTLGRPVKRKGFSWFLEKVVPTLSENVVVLMVGPFKKEANSNLFWKLLPKNIKNQIELANGGISDEATITELLRQETLKTKVFQAGKLPLEQLLSTLYLADIFVMPNVKIHGTVEGFGLVALEAALCKTIVLASELEGITDAIKDGQNGYLLPSDNAQAWIDKIQKLLADSTTLEKKSLLFRTFTIQNYGWEKMADGYIHVFQSILKTSISEGVMIN